MEQHDNTSQLTSIYHDKCIALARSLVIKSEGTMLAMHRETNEQYAKRGLPSPDDEKDMTTWRYYKHLAGDYHPMDEIMTVRSLDTLQMIEFTKDVLKDHRATLKHYQDKGEFYQSLLQAYPDQHLLIDGICRPIDYDTSVYAEDYTILDYDHTLVESNEVNIMGRLKQQVKHFMTRYHNEMYLLFDPLYEATKLGILAIHLPGWIVALREQEVGTVFAHSYHIWNRLGSYFSLDRYKKYLTNEQALWLYRNIRYLDIHAGKEGNFNRIVYWLLTKRQIPLYRYMMGTDTTNVLAGRGKYGHIHDAGSIFGIIPSIEREQMNLLQYDFNTEDNYTIEKLVNKENGLAGRNDQFTEQGITETSEAFKSSRIDQRSTKLLESTLITYDQQEVFPINMEGLQNWIWMAYSGRYSYVGNTTNPKNGEVVTLTAQEGYVLFHYLCQKLANQWGANIENAYIPDVYVSGILFDNIDWEDIKAKYIVDYAGIDEGIDYLRERCPIYKTIYSTDEFRQFVDHMQAFKYDCRVAYGYFQDLKMYGEMRHFTERLFYRTLIPLTDKPMRYGEYFNTRHWSFAELNREQMIHLLGELYGIFTGDSLRSKDNAGEIQRAMIAILRRLSSYTIQFTSEVIGENTTVLDMPFIRFGHVRTLQRDTARFFVKWLMRWKKLKSKEFNIYRIRPPLNEDTLELHSKERDTVSLPNVVDLRLRGKSETWRHVLLPFVGISRASTNEHRVYPSYYYIHNGTLYRRFRKVEDPLELQKQYRLGTPGNLGDDELEINPGEPMRV